MPVFRLDTNDLTFPAPFLAEPNGLLAIGGDLHPQRLLVAYQNGIFPWFENEGNFFWYSPDPRCVLFPDELIIHKSMRSIFNQQKFSFTFDKAFAEVMQQCSNTPRMGQEGSWISDDFVENYSILHHSGIAHSLEVWENDILVGGLYGLAIGKIFFGESMFSQRPNASKAGFITLVQTLRKAGFVLIDCQQHTNHLVSLGAKSIKRDLFLEYLERNIYVRTEVGYWMLNADQTLQINQIKQPA